MPQQTQPQKITRTTTSTSTTSTTSSSTGPSPLGFILADKEAREKDRLDQEKLTQKYSSIDSKVDAEKIEALKNVNLNPYRLKNPYDGLANSLHRWTRVANDAVLNHYTDEQKKTIASNYYDGMIGPLYGNMKIAPMNKDLWMKQSFKEAVNYNIEDAYNNSAWHGMKHGWDSGWAATARAYGYVADQVGNVYDNAVDQWRKSREVGKKYDTDNGGWHQELGKTQLEKPVAHIPGAVSRGAAIQDANHQFWADALPNPNWKAGATSFAVEQIAQAPVYAAMYMGTRALGAVPGVSNLTKVLNATPAGKKVFQYLMAGTEGLAYGTLTRPQEDKAQAWRDAVGFMVFHGIFDVAGMGLKKAIDIAGPNDLPKMKARQDKLDLAMEGKRSANSTEVYAQHKTEVGNNLAVMGVDGQRQVYTDALHHVEDIEGRGWDKEQIKDHELHLMMADPARFGPMLSSAKYIRSLLGATGKRLSEIKPGSEEEQFLSSRLARLIIDSGSEMNQNVEGLKESIGKAAEAQSKEPSAKNTMDFYRAKVAAQVAKENPAVAKMMKPEELEQLAVKAMSEDQEKAAKIGEDEVSKDKTEEANNIAKRRKADTVPALREKTKRTTDKYGQPAVSYSINSDYKVQLKTYIKQAKEQGISLSKFFEDMSDEDFGKDLSDHFYPQALKDSKVFFEGQHTREGNQNPNFLGFMYNYIHEMPREFGRELENRLANSMKVQKFMSGRRPSGPQLMYFAKAMYNHVDNFLGSGRWPKESNIFRSTQDTMWQSTQWQQQLLREKMVTESKNLKNMFASNTKALKSAMSTYNAFAKKRLKEYAKGPKDMRSQDKIKDIDSKISDLFTSTGERERIPF